MLAYTEPGDGVILLTPVYYPFSFAVSRNDRKEVRCPLVNINGRYEIDYELLEDLCEMDEGDMTKTISVLNRLLGTEQKERLKEHLRMKNGRVPASKMMNEIGEIFRNVKEGKNS